MSETPKIPNVTCHIHKDCHKTIREEVLRIICKDLEVYEHSDGKHYCILHLPTNEKDVSAFEKVFRSRLKEIDDKIKEIEKKYTKKEFQSAHFEPYKNGEIKLQKYYFCYVWFPSKVELNGREFKAEVDFMCATFSADVSFVGSSFLGGCNFSFALFSAKASFVKSVFAEFAYFDKPEFVEEANFRETVFLAPWVNFGRAIFHSNAYFDSSSFGSKESLCNISFELSEFRGWASFQRCSFSGITYFNSTIFSLGASFSHAKILETSHIEFQGTRFCSNVDFSQTEFDGFTNFSLNCFRNTYEVQEIKEWLKNDKITDGQEASLSFKDARFNRPERVSFNSLILRPSWFVHAEVRNIVFNDVKWLNLEIDVDKNSLVLETKLGGQQQYQPNEPLIKTFNQLSDNAEANRRFEESRIFQKLSIALKNYQCYVTDGHDKSEREDIREKVCGNYPVVNEDSGQYYCLWHNPDKNKAEIFREEFNKLLKSNHTDFRHVIFPINIRFDGDLPSKLDFSGARFQRRVVFHEAKIHKLNFSDSYFEEKAELLFEYSTCDGKIDLDRVVFDGKLNIKGMSGYDFFTRNGGLTMREARFDKPIWVNFRNVRLFPHFFVDVDVSKFIFHDCTWNEVDEKSLNIKKELRHCKHKELVQTCNQLAINYEENRQFDESSMFRYAAMETKRLDNQGFWKYLNLYWFYKWSSGYGENWRRAGVVLLGILILFGILYATPFTRFDYGEKKREIVSNEVDQMIYNFAGEGERFHEMSLPDGLVHSFAVASFQRPDPKPADILTKALVVLETILAPLQAALLALAIRRKFMR